MDNALQVITCEVATLEDPGLREVYDAVPSIEKKCREIKTEVKKRITDNGELQGLKIVIENAGVKVTDMGELYHALQDYIDKDTFIKECCTINMTALKKVVIPVMQEIALADGEKRSKVELNAQIDRLALQFGEKKTKNSIM